MSEEVNADSETPRPKPRIRWFVYGGPDENGRLLKMPRTANMRGHWAGYDAECSCGWATNTGGAIRSYIRNEVWLHKRIECPLLHPETA